MAADYVFAFSTPATDPCSQSFTPIYNIQGSGLSAAITGAVTTQGVVVGDFELPGGTGQIRGFYLQDVAGDGNPATSDGIFVFTGGADTTSLGQVVRVQGTAEDFSSQTQISSATVTACGSTGSVSPVDVTLPFADGDYPERYEGMLVRLPQTLYVTEHFQLGRFGQAVLTSRPDRLQQPTNVVAPGAPALALQAANNRDRIILDDDNNSQNPDPILFGRGGVPLSASNTLRGGDSAAGIVGVLVQDWAGNAASPTAYRVRPIGALNGGAINFQPANPRPAAPAIPGRLRVTSANLLNYFNTFGSGLHAAAWAARPWTAAGPTTPTEFARQWPKTVANLLGGDADVIGVMEMENDGYGASSAIQDLVTKLNAATAAGTYAFIDADTLTGQTNALGTDAIKVGLIYKPAKVSPVGTTAALNSTAFVNGGDSGPRNRPALAQAFQELSSGERFIVVVNHLKSKGSACAAPDAGDGQGNCNVVRTNAANTMTAWLVGNPTGTGDPDILIMGDLNAYAKEDPITAIKSAGYVNLPETRIGADAYSYAFDGQWGYLDHALATTSLAGQVAGVAAWHINADEPSVLDYNTEFKTAGQIASLYSRRPVPLHRPRPGDHRAEPAQSAGGHAGRLRGPGRRATGSLVSWETVSELDNAGFNLYRTGSVATGPSRTICWPSCRRRRRAAAQGCAYSYEDLAVQPGETWVLLAGGCQPERRDHAAWAGQRDGAGADRGDAELRQRDAGGCGRRFAALAAGCGWRGRGSGAGAPPALEQEAGRDALEIMDK
ncbi:MAG: ExeM/NucH family extracellular endonuclease [Anaerolineae bacterium]